MNMELKGFIIVSFFVTLVLSITTKTQVHTLQQIINNINTETNEELLERVLQTPLAAGPSGNRYRDVIVYLMIIVVVKVME